MDVTTVNPRPATYARSSGGPWHSGDFEAQVHQVETSRGRLNYVDRGEGDACLLIHGHGASWQYWIETITVLSNARRVLALDLPGFGRSALPRWADLSMTTIASAVKALAGALDVTSIDIVGHSMGTLVGCEVAAAYPELVRSLTLVNGPTLSVADFFRHPAQIRRTHPRLASAVIADLATSGVPLPARVKRKIAFTPSMRRVAFAPIMSRPEMLDPNLALQLMSGVGARGYYLVPLKSRSYDPRQAQVAIQCPVGLINGADDHWVPREDIEAICAVAPVKSSLVISGAKHLVNIEWPDLFHELVVDFIDGLPASERRS